MQRKLWLVPLAALLALMLALGAACEDDDGGNGVTEDPTEELTQGAGGDGETPADGAQTPDAGGNGGTEIDIVAENSEEFTEDTLTASSGTFTVVFDNRDDGVTHNFALYDSPDSASTLIDATELLPGPSTDEVSFDGLESGEYYYNCQVHPNMTGVLTVE